MKKMRKEKPPNGQSNAAAVGNSKRENKQTSAAE